MILIRKSSKLKCDAPIQAIAGDVILAAYDSVPDARIFGHLKPGVTP